MKLLLTILTILLTHYSFSQDSVKVKIVKIKTEYNLTRIWMKDEKGKKYYSECTCKVPNKEKDFIWIKKP